jgi:curved DNA-binding protein CbpA
MAKNWRRRYFVLNFKDRTLRYFADESKDSEKGLFHLLPGSTIKDSDLKPNCFQLITKSIGTNGRLDSFGRQQDGGELCLFVCTESAPEKVEWVQALEATIHPNNVTTTPSSTKAKKKSVTALECAVEGCKNSHRYTDGYCHEHRAQAATARAEKIANLLMDGDEEKKVDGEEDDEVEDCPLTIVAASDEKRVREFNTLSATRRNYGIKGAGGTFMEMLATQEPRSQHQVQMLPNSKGVLTVKVFEDVDPLTAVAGTHADMKLLGKIKLTDFTLNVPVDVTIVFECTDAGLVVSLADNIRQSRHATALFKFEPPVAPKDGFGYGVKDVDGSINFVLLPRAMLPDHYSVLAVNSNATANDVRKAYHKQSKMYHPDKLNSDSAAGGALAGEAASKEGREAMMTRINAAYAALSGAEERAEYDREFRGYESTQAISAAVSDNGNVGFTVYQGRSPGPIDEENKVGFVKIADLTGEERQISMTFKYDGGKLWVEALDVATGKSSGVKHFNTATIAQERDALKLAPAKEGVLQKKGEKRHNWTERYFVLRGNWYVSIRTATHYAHPARLRAFVVTAVAFGHYPIPFLLTRMYAASSDTCVCYFLGP